MILAGARREQQNEIKRMADDGMGSKEISQILKINEDTVKSFMDFDHAQWEKEQNAKLAADKALEEEKKIAAEAGATVALQAAKKKKGG